MPCPNCGAITKDDALCSDCKTIAATVERIGNHSRGVGRIPRIQKVIGGAKPRLVEKVGAKPAREPKEVLVGRLQEFAPRYKQALADAKVRNPELAQKYTGLFTKLTKESNSGLFDLAMLTLGTLTEMIDAAELDSVDKNAAFDPSEVGGALAENPEDTAKAQALRERFAQLESRINSADKDISELASETEMLLWDKEEADEAVAKLDELERQIDLKEQERETDVLSANLNQVVNLLKNVPLGMGASTAPLFEKEYAACLQIKDLSERKAKLLALLKKAQSAAALAMSATEVVMVIPQMKKEFLVKLETAAKTQKDADIFRSELQKLKQKGPEDAARATRIVTDRKDEDLKALSIDLKIGLLTHLRRGDPSTQKDRRTAIAKLYAATELDEKFLESDNQKRENVLNRLKEVQIATGDVKNRKNRNLSEIRKDWANVSKEDREKVLKEVLRIQCGEMKIDTPEMKFFSDPSSNVSDEKKLDCAGYCQGDKIYINDTSESFDDFDDLLDTVIHENTHNYQRVLIEKLQAGELEDADGNKSDQYNQALLFELNSGDGHFEGGVDDAVGYMKCPKERHAWLAGGEASKLFIEDAKVEAGVFLNQMAECAKKNPDDAKDVVLYTKQLNKLLSQEKVSASQIVKQIRQTTYALEKSAADRSGKQIAANNKADVEILKNKIATWVNDNYQYNTRAGKLREAIEKAELTKDADTIAAAIRTNQLAFEALRKEAEQPKADARAPFRLKAEELSKKMMEWARDQKDTGAVAIIEKDIKDLNEDLRSKPVNRLAALISNFEAQFERRLNG